MLQPFQNIKITEGNDFSLLFPLKTRVYVNGRPIDSDVDILALTDVVVKCGDMTMPCTQQADGLLVDFPDTLAKGTYDIVITAQYRGHELRAAYFEALTIVAWSYQSDAQAYMQGSPILVQPAFVVYNLTDAELAQLKQDLRDAIAAAEQAEADAEQAKREWEQRAAELDDVAKETTSQQILTAVGSIDFSTLAKQGSDPTATNTAILSAITGFQDVVLEDYADQLYGIIGGE